MRLTSDEVDRIETVIDKSEGRFAGEALAKLRILRARLHATGIASIGNDQAAFCHLVADVALELKGLGGTFGYPVLTAVAKSLHDFIEGRTAMDATRTDIVQHHLDAMYRVVEEGLKGPGGAREDALLSAFHTATEKYQ